MKKKKIQSRISGSSCATANTGSVDDGSGKSPREGDESDTDGDSSETLPLSAAPLPNSAETVSSPPSEGSYFPLYSKNCFSEYIHRATNPIQLPTVPNPHNASAFGMLPHPSEMLRNINAANSSYPEMYSHLPPPPSRGSPSTQPLWINSEASDNSSPSMAGLLCTALENGSCLEQLGSPPKAPSAMISSLLDQPTSTAPAFEPVQSYHQMSSHSAYLTNGYGSQQFYEENNNNGFHGSSTQAASLPPVPLTQGYNNGGYFPPVSSMYSRESSGYGYEPYTSMFNPSENHTPATPPSNGFPPFSPANTGERGLNLVWKILRQSQPTPTVQIRPTAIAPPKNPPGYTW